jgi:hypothetical protein
MKLFDRDSEPVPFHADAPEKIRRDVGFARVRRAPIVRRVLRENELNVVIHGFEDGGNLTAAERFVSCANQVNVFL